VDSKTGSVADYRVSHLGAPEIAAALKVKTLPVLRYLLPNGKCIANEYCVGSLDGEPGKSLKVNLKGKVGVWKDFATGQSGGDLLDLWAHVRCRGDLAAAMQEAADWLAQPSARTRQHVTGKGATNDLHFAKAQIVLPVPDDVDPPDFGKLLGRQPDEVYDYFDERGHLIGHRVRMNGKWNEVKSKHDKDILPITLWCTARGKREWRVKAWPVPRPLFGLEQLSKKPDALVVLFEGEKKALAAQRLLPEVAAVSLSGGTGQVPHQDLSPLSGRRVVAWPDADNPGKEAMAQAAARLREASAASCGVVQLPDGLPTGWDIADELPDGWTVETLLKLIDEAVANPSAANTEPEPQAEPRPEAPRRSYYSAPEWIERDIRKPDFLLGELLSTTTRAMLVGPTGAGKTMLLLALANAIASSKGFLQWRSRRPAKVLYIDGEMSSEAMQERVKTEAKRAGGASKNLVILCREDCENMLPLNTPEGQAFIDRVIDETGAMFVFFDNIQALLVGDMKDEESWAQALPWVKDMTRRHIGQMWAHHTGHDETRSYGTKTREWHLDLVAIMRPVPQSTADLAFDLSFTKARRRTPANRSDFEPVSIALVGDQWTSDGVAAATAKAPTGKDRAFLDVLTDAIAIHGEPHKSVVGHPLAVTVEQWKRHAVSKGLLDGPEQPDGPWRQSARSLFSRHRANLVSGRHVVVEGDFVWLFRAATNG
jgi:hypothetical protein